MKKNFRIFSEEFFWSEMLNDCIMYDIIKLFIKSRINVKFDFFNEIKKIKINELIPITSNKIECINMNRYLLSEELIGISKSVFIMHNIAIMEV